MSANIDIKSGRLLYTVREACGTLSLSRTTLYELIRSGALQAIKIGTRGVRISAEELERFANSGGVDRSAGGY
ncbi:MAG: helix-turn-helix domain-containing protein [Fimbriimonadaceae bacterium]